MFFRLQTQLSDDGSLYKLPSFITEGFSVIICLFSREKSVKADKQLCIKKSLKYSQGHTVCAFPSAVNKPIYHTCSAIKSFYILAQFLQKLCWMWYGALKMKILCGPDDLITMDQRCYHNTKAGGNTLFGRNHQWDIFIYVPLQHMLISPIYNSIQFNKLILA